VTTALLVLPLLVGVLALIVFLFISRRSVRARARRLHAKGLDPDRAFLGALAEQQALQKGRRRTPAEWVSVKYIQWVRGRGQW
jgi:hypothetical protein